VERPLGAAFWLFPSPVTRLAFAPRMWEARGGVGRRGVERPSGAAFWLFPSPVTRLAFAPRMWEARGGGREARGGAPFGRGLSIFPVSRHPFPAHCPVGAASCRDSSASCGRGWKPLPQSGSLPRLPSPVSRALSERLQPRPPAAAEAGGGSREARVGAPFGRGLSIFPVSRSPPPVHSPAGLRPRPTCARGWRRRPARGGRARRPDPPRSGRGAPGRARTAPRAARDRAPGSAPR